LAINLPTDVVLGVANAADPQKMRAAVARLQNAGAAARADFQTLVTQSAAAAPKAGASTATAPPASVPSPGVSRHDDGKLGTFGKLEAFVLQTYVQSMFPKEASSFFGKGTAGAIWKSMLAEQLANQLAQSGQIGLAKHFAAAHVGAGSHAASSAVTAKLLRASAGRGPPQPLGAPAPSATLAPNLAPPLAPTVGSALKPGRKPAWAQSTAGANGVIATSPTADDWS
jgi:peptidoglycan hydrolase FlgJ